MQESSIIQYFTEKGIEQGKKQYAVEAILTVLEIRFQEEVIRDFEEAIAEVRRERA